MIGKNKENGRLMDGHRADDRLRRKKEGVKSMEILKQRILKDGNVKEGNVLKVDSFLNHQMDIHLLDEIGKEFRRRFDGEGVNKILTIEASGIGIAVAVAQHFDYAPVVFAKKSKSKNLDGELYTSKVTSFTRGATFDVQVSKKYLNPGDRVLIIDDFLAKGQALMGLLDIVAQSGATTVGCGIVIEKGFQEGGQMLREKGANFEQNPNVDIREYINDMDDCLAAADLVICRAGASTLSELEAAGRASILIPSPNVAENHQYHNGMVLVNNNAAVLIEEKNLTGESLCKAVEELVSQPQKLRELGQNAQKLSMIDANERIYEELMRVYRSKK